MSADRFYLVPSTARDTTPSVARGILTIALLFSLSGCSWFTDFKEQPKIDPWDSTDSTPPRGNPQGSVSIYGTAAPEFLYARGPQALDAMSALVNPVANDQRSVDRGRISYQINCSVCHGPLGMGNGAAVKYGVYPPAVGPNSPAANLRSDGYIFGVIRNGRGLMPPYNRIEEAERWDIVNYLRALQGKSGIASDSSHGLPGETGDKLPGASVTAPTRSAPYYNQIGSQAGAREGLMGSANAGVLPGGKPAVARPDTARPPAITPAPAHKPPTQEDSK